MLAVEVGENWGEVYYLRCFMLLCGVVRSSVGESYSLVFLPSARHEEWISRTGVHSESQQLFLPITKKRLRSIHHPIALLPRYL